MENIILWMIGACLVGVLVIMRPVRLVLRIGLGAIMGGLGIYITNIFLAPLGIFVGLNVVTLGIVALLGLPGFLMLYIASAFIG